MISFNNDYSEGACDEILQALWEINRIQQVGYGMDEISETAKKTIQEKLQYENCDIHFLVGGTQANTTIIASMLRPYEAVVAVESGHINVHETGAIEATGHKVVAMPGKDGKITVEDIRKAVRIHSDEHMVKPAMVYISNATEIGTIYQKEELQEIYEECQRLGLYLFMDGARMANALSAKDNTLALEDLCHLCDVFYLGGTKDGALFGEAVVIVNDALKNNFRYMIKQRGGMLAKGWLLGIQFLTLFQKDLFLKHGNHANEMAQKLQKAMEEKGISFFIKTSTNQIFPILKKEWIAELSKKYRFQKWEDVDATQTAMRFVCSWATKEEDVIALMEDIKAL